MEPLNTDVARMADLHRLPEMTYNDYDSVDRSNDSSDWGSAETQLPISLKQTKFSLKRFAKGMGQANYSALNEWNKYGWLGF